MRDKYRIHHSFKFALNGIYQAIKDNRNLRIHIVVGILVLTLSFLLGVTSIEKIVIMTMVILVIASEMINTALEEMTDLIVAEHHREEAKIAKDVAAGMVLVVSVFAAIIGVVILLPYVI